MKTPATINKTVMKKALLLLMFFTGLAYGQPAISNPTPYQVCDDPSNDGIETFDLSTKNAEILGTNDPSLFSIGYFSDSTCTVSISNSYTTSSTTVYAKVWENVNLNNFATTSLALIVTHVSGTNPGNIVVQDIPYDGFYTFDLTTKSSTIIGTQTNCTVSYFELATDANAGTNPIIAPAAYTNTANPQYIYYRITNTLTGCSYVSSFFLYIVNEPILSFTDVSFKDRLLEANSSSIHPPMAFNNSLGQITIDANSDGEIEQSEADAVTFLNISNYDVQNMGQRGTIQNLDGIGHFTNLSELFCISQSINTIDQTQLTHLTQLNCSTNNLTTLDVTALTSLTSLNCSTNQLSTLNVAPLTNLTALSCMNNNLTTLNVAPLVNLQQLACDNNQIAALNVAPLTNLISLSCNSNTLTALNVSPLTNLQTLNCGSNQIATLDVSTLAHLATLNLSSNLITTINLAGLTNLTSLNTANNGIATVAIAPLTNLTSLNCSNNLMTSIDVSSLTHLTSLACGATNLISIFMKNGANGALSLASSPNLQYICADETQITAIQATAAANASLNTVVNSYCSFTPNGNYNTITGNMTYDANNNGCDASDPAQPNIRLDINDGTTTGSSFSNATGNYTFYTPAGTFTLTPNIENPAFFNFSPPTATVAFLDTNNNTNTQNFCITANGIHPDLEVVLLPITPARPGFDATYRLVYKNKGNQTLTNGLGLSLGFDTAKMSLVSSSQIPANAAANQLQFDYSINPFEEKYIDLAFHINSPTSASPVNIGDVLVFNATINPIVGDEAPLDNVFTYNQTVVGSFDPNSIECLEGASLDASLIGNYLHYAVNFENDGTYEAANIVVKDVIDTTQYDISSLQVLETSNPAYIKITGNVVEFIFKEIHLPPHTSSPPVGGHGNVLFKIRSKNSLVAGDYVTKTAKIFFDYNAPIDTNISQTVYQGLTASTSVFDNSVSVYPNPTNSIITIKCNNTIQSIQLYDVMGRLLETSLENNVATKLDISERVNGIYFVKIVTEKGSKVEKIVKE